MNILITAGGTKEYIDGVRYIGNSSSGRTGAQMTEYLMSKGHHVTWLGAKDAIKPATASVFITYETFDDLAAGLQKTMAEQHFDVVFHAAAVSDFKVTAVILNNTVVPAGRDCKLPTSDHANLRLERNPKLIDSIKSWSKNPELLLVGFKLTNTASDKAVKKAVNRLIERGHVDCVAQNNLPDITEHQHILNLHHADGRSEVCPSPEDLCDRILNLMEQAA